MNVHHLTKTLHHTVYPAISPSNSLNSAQGKTVVISGGASGIVYGIAQAFAAAGAATVVIVARRQEALDESSTNLRAEIANSGGKTEVWTFLLDITKETGVDATFEDIRKRLNKGQAPDGPPKDVDVLVTSAAHTVQDETTLECSSQVYRDAFETNFFGNLNLARAFLNPEIPSIPLTRFDGFVKQTAPSRYPHHQKPMLDVSSISSFMVFPAQGTYGPSKLAFTRAMQHLQAEVNGLPGTPIRIHSFHPGAVYTPATAASIKIKLEGVDWDDESLPGGFAVWLASPAAAFLKGRLVFSNWDVEELMALKEKYDEDPEFGTITLKI